MVPASPCVVCPHHDPQHQQQIFWGYLTALVCILLGIRTTELEQHFLPFRQLCKSALEATEPGFHLTSSTSLPLTAQLSLPPEKCPPCPTPPRPTCKDLPLVLGCHFCQRFCNTSGGGVLTPRCQHYYHLGGCKQLQTDRQLPWHSGLAGRDFMEEKSKPGFSSSRRLTEGVLLSSEHWRLGWSDSRAWPQSHHSNEVFLAWCQLHHRHKPAFQRGRVQGAGGTCWTALLTFPISKDESTGPVQSTAQELLISSSASKWPTSWLKYDGDFNHCFCSSPEKTLHSN